MRSAFCHWITHYTAVCYYVYLVTAHYPFTRCGFCGYGWLFTCRTPPHTAFLRSVTVPFTGSAYHVYYGCTARGYRFTTRLLRYLFAYHTYTTGLQFVHRILYRFRVPAATAVYHTRIWFSHARFFARLHTCRCRLRTRYTRGSRGSTAVLPRFFGLRFVLHTFWFPHVLPVYVGCRCVLRYTTFVYPTFAFAFPALLVRLLPVRLTYTFYHGSALPHAAFAHTLHIFYLHTVYLLPRSRVCWIPDTAPAFTLRAFARLRSLRLPHLHTRLRLPRVTQLHHWLRLPPQVPTPHSPHYTLHAARYHTPFCLYGLRLCVYALRLLPLRFAVGLFYGYGCYRTHPWLGSTTTVCLPVPHYAGSLRLQFTHCHTRVFARFFGLPFGLPTPATADYSSAGSCVGSAGSAFHAHCVALRTFGSGYHRSATRLPFAHTPLPFTLHGYRYTHWFWFHTFTRLHTRCRFAAAHLPAFGYTTFTVTFCAGCACCGYGYYYTTHAHLRWFGSGSARCRTCTPHAWFRFVTLVYTFCTLRTRLRYAHAVAVYTRGYAPAVTVRCHTIHLRSVADTLPPALLHLRSCFTRLRLQPHYWFSFIATFLRSLHWLDCQLFCPLRLPGYGWLRTRIHTSAGSYLPLSYLLHAHCLPVYCRFGSGSATAFCVTWLVTVLPHLPPHTGCYLGSGSAYGLVRIFTRVLVRTTAAAVAAAGCRRVLPTVYVRFAVWITHAVLTRILRSCLPLRCSLLPGSHCARAHYACWFNTPHTLRTPCYVTALRTFGLRYRPHHVTCSSVGLPRMLLRFVCVYYAAVARAFAHTATTCCTVVACLPLPFRGLLRSRSAFTHLVHTRHFTTAGCAFIPPHTPRTLPALFWLRRARFVTPHSVATPVLRWFTRYRAVARLLPVATITLHVPHAACGLHLVGYTFLDYRWFTRGLHTTCRFTTTPLLPRLRSGSGSALLHVCYTPFTTVAGWILPTMILRRSTGIFWFIYLRLQFGYAFVCGLPAHTPHCGLRTVAGLPAHVLPVGCYARLLAPVYVHFMLRWLVTGSPVTGLRLRSFGLSVAVPAPFMPHTYRLACTRTPAHFALCLYPVTQFALPAIAAHTIPLVTVGSGLLTQFRLYTTHHHHSSCYLHGCIATLPVTVIAVIFVTFGSHAYGCLHTGLFSAYPVLTFVYRSHYRTARFCLRLHTASSWFIARLRLRFTVTTRTCTFTHFASLPRYARFIPRYVRTRLYAACAGSRGCTHTSTLRAYTAVYLVADTFAAAVAGCCIRLRCVLRTPHAGSLGYCRFLPTTPGWVGSPQHTRGLPYTLRSAAAVLRYVAARYAYVFTSAAFCTAPATRSAIHHTRFWILCYLRFFGYTWLLQF